MFCHPNFPPKTAVRPRAVYILKLYFSFLFPIVVLYSEINQFRSSDGRTDGAAYRGMFARRPTCLTAWRPMEGGHQNRSSDSVTTTERSPPVARTETELAGGGVVVKKTTWYEPNGSQVQPVRLRRRSRDHVHTICRTTAKSTTEWVLY